MNRSTPNASLDPPPLSSFTSQRINRKFHRKPILIIYSYRKSFLLRSIGRSKIRSPINSCCCCRISLVDVQRSDISFLSCLGFSSLTSGRQKKNDEKSQTGWLSCRSKTDSEEIADFAIIALRRFSWRSVKNAFALTKENHYAQKVLRQLRQHNSKANFFSFV